MNYSFESYFKELKETGDNVKFVIVLGSGFHKHALRNNSNVNNCLSSWCCLLKEIKPNLDLSNNYLLDFERIILDNTNSQDEKAAFKIENEILKKVVTIIDNYQSEVIKNKNLNYPINIFKSNYISDVISLNFDLIPELLLKNNRKTKVQNLIKHKNKKSIIHSTRHRVINGINFWHPHGDVEKYDSLILGTRKYGLHVNKIEKLRERSKQKKKPENYQKSWYDVLTHNPVIILGADISDMELDIWNAIVNRERNFGKKENSKQHKFPIFQMRKLCSENKTKVKSNEIWFKPLFDEKLNFEEQWNRLDNLFKN
jgi:hypothetical protein